MIQAIKIIFSVLVALVLTVFAVKNSQIVGIDLWPLPLQFKLTLSLVLMGTFFVGALAGGFLVWASHFRKRFLRKKPRESEGATEAQKPHYTLPEDL